MSLTRFIFSQFKSSFFLLYIAIMYLYRLSQYSLCCQSFERGLRAEPFLSKMAYFSLLFLVTGARRSYRARCRDFCQRKWLTEPKKPCPKVCLKGTMSSEEYSMKTFLHNKAAKKFKNHQRMYRKN